MLLFGGRSIVERRWDLRRITSSRMKEKFCIFVSLWGGVGNTTKKGWKSRVGNDWGEEFIFIFISCLKLT